MFIVTVQQTIDNGYIVSGSSESNDKEVTGNHGASDDWIVKLNNSGNIQWEKCYGGSNGEVSNCIQKTNDGGYIIAGQGGSTDGDLTGHKIGGEWIVKLDELGNIQWENSYGGTSEEDDACNIQQTNDGGYIIAGLTMSNNGEVTGDHLNNGEPTADEWIVKIDGSGNIQWEKCYGGSMWDEAYCIQQTTDGGYIVAGSSNSNDGDVIVNPEDGAWILKLDGTGNIQWQKSFPNTESQTIQQTMDGGYVFAGAWENDDAQIYSSIIYKLNDTGVIEWQYTFSNNISLNGGSFVDVQQTSDGWYIVSGSSTDTSLAGYHGSADFWVVKFGPPLPSISSSQQQIFPSLLCSPVESDRCMSAIPGICR